MGKKNIDTVVAGHICLDVIPEFINGRRTHIEEIFKPGRLINIGDVAISTGGPVSNTGLALHRLGIKVEFIGKIGHDPFGSIILEKLEEIVATNGMRVVEGENTSYTIVIAPPGIDRIFLHNPGANDTFSYNDINFDLVGKAKLFHLGYPPLMRCLYENHGDQLAKIYRRAKELGTITSLDVSLPDPNSSSGRIDWNIILKNVLPYVDIFLPSAEELLYMLEKKEFFKWLEALEDNDLLAQFEGEDLTRLSEKVLELGVKIAAIKCGYRGFYIRTAKKSMLSKASYALHADLDNWSNRELWAPAYHVSEIVSATGSGDSAIAGFLAAYLRGNTIEMALKYACTVGAQNLQALDAVSGICSWKKTTVQIEENRKRDSLDIKAQHWEFDKEGEVWKGPNDRK